MNNYSWVQKRLHQLALSSKFMREVTFDFEDTYISKNLDHQNHVFITGLARSGTTILLNAIYQSDIFASLSYADMPFVLAPNLWSKIYFKRGDLAYRERSHQDGIKININSPEAFEEVFWNTFDESEDETLNKFRSYIASILKKNKKFRYLSKNNQNVKRIPLISNIFSSAKILIPFRDPIQHAYSLLNQHIKFIKESNMNKFTTTYMKWIGHTEFGPNYVPIINEKITFKNFDDINHWLEQWYLTYTKLMNELESYQNVYFICYEELCSSNYYWLKIKDLLQINNSYKFNFRESKKKIPISINKKIEEKSSILYSKLHELSF